MLVDKVAEVCLLLISIFIDEYVFKVVFVDCLLLEICGFIICERVESEVESYIYEIRDVGTDIENVFCLIAVDAASVCLL